MFDSSYYKNRFVYTFEKDGYKAMVQYSKVRNEYYIFIPNKEKPGDYIILLRKNRKNAFDFNRAESLGKVLASHGFTDIDFINPLGRTKKIVNVLNVINKLEKQDEKIMIKK